MNSKKNFFNKEVIKNNFSTQAREYNSNAIIQAKVAKNLVSFLKKYDSDDKHKVLDLGSGTGFLSKNLLKVKYRNIFELDLSIEMLKNWKNKPKHINSIQGDIENMPIKNLSFDIIVSSFALHWVNNLKKVFSDCFGLLKDNGIMAIAIPTKDSINELKKLGIFYLNEMPSCEIIDSSAKSAGFKIVLSEEKKLQQKFANIFLALKFFKKIGANYNNNKNFKSNNSKIYQNSIYSLKKNSYQNNSFILTWKVKYLILKK